MSVKEYEQIRDQMKGMIEDIIKDEQGDSDEDEVKQPKTANNVKNEAPMSGKIRKAGPDKLAQDLLKQYGYIK